MIKNVLLVITSLILSIFAIAQNGKISGKVLNVKNEALQGVSVKIVGAPGGTTTDLEGRYTINLQAAKNSNWNLAQSATNLNR